MPRGFIPKEAKVHRGYVSSPRSHSHYLSELGLEQQCPSLSLGLFRDPHGCEQRLQKWRTRVFPAGGAGVGSWKAQMPLSGNHKPPRGPREGDWGLIGSSFPVSGMAFLFSWCDREVSNVSRDARSLWISACLQGLCTLRICSV